MPFCRETTDPAPRPLPRFIADAMLGRLTKWLRLLGYDVAYEKKIGDRELMERAMAENRILLTRDHHFLNRRLPEGVLLFRFENDRLPDQLRRIVQAFHLSTDRHRLSRCVECNLLVNEISREAADGRVPDYVHRTQNHFSECPGCHRIFWAGTHPVQINRRLEGMIGLSEDRTHD
jgi:uncharacterized protein